MAEAMNWDHMMAKVILTDEIKRSVEELRKRQKLNSALYFSICLFKENEGDGDCYIR